MTLEDWLTNRWLHAHESSAEEIAALLKSADEDLRNAGIEGVSAGWRLNMAYTAALRFARAALYARGYRPSHEREHERTIDSLTYTLPDLPADTIKLLHKIRKLRHVAVYDALEGISDSEADAAVRAAAALGRKVKASLAELG